MDDQALELAAARDAAESANRSKSDFLANMKSRDSHANDRDPGLRRHAGQRAGIDRAPPERRHALVTIKNNGEICSALSTTSWTSRRSRLANSISSISNVRRAKFAKMSSRSCAVVARPSRSGCRLSTRRRFHDDPLRSRAVPADCHQPAQQFDQIHRTRRSPLVVGCRARHNHWSCDDAARDARHGDRHDCRATGEAIPPFTQADSSTTRKYGGHWAGTDDLPRLPTCSEARSTSRANTARERRSRSVCRRATLPVATVSQPGERAANAAVSKKPPERLEYRILVAEDGPDNQRLLQTFPGQGRRSIDLGR